MDAPRQPALTGLAPRRRRSSAAPGPIADRLPVAQVVIDRPHPHLDRVFDYLVPAALAETTVAGVRVKVPFGRQDVDGFCVARRDVSAHDGELARIRRVVSPEPVLTEELLRLCRAVAERWVGTTADVLRLAVPGRHATVEQEGWPEPDEGPAPPGAAAPGPGWARATGVEAYLRRVGAGEAPRAAWLAVPVPGAGWADAVAEAVLAARSSGRGAVVVAPSASAVASLGAALEVAGVPAWRPGTRGGWVRLVAEDGPAQRYRSFLAVTRGVAPIVIGTRAAAYAPVADLGLVACWDEADDLHAEQRAPYPHARDVLALRAEVQSAALLVAGFVRSAAVQRWIATGWARGLEVPRPVVRELAPRVVALTSVELASEGPAARARLPGKAWRAIGTALRSGPVLIQVPRAGYLPAVACQRCRGVAHCPSCAGPLQITGTGHAAVCRWCGRPAGSWRCPECSGTTLRSLAVGSDRTAEELGRAFPGVPVRVSGAGPGVLGSVPPSPALVVATPGAEPDVDGGYAAAALLDAGTVTARASLDVSVQALRTWVEAARRVRPAEAGGVVFLVGDAAPVPTQALVRWDPAWLAERERAERAELGLPPATHCVVLEGPRAAVTALLAALELPGSTQVLGPTPTGEDAEENVLDPESVRPVRALLRTPWREGSAVTTALRAAVATRSAARQETVRVRAEPADPAEAR